MADLSSLKDLAPASEASAPVHVRKVDTLGRSYATGKRKNAVAPRMGQGWFRQDHHQRP